MTHKPSLDKPIQITFDKSAKQFVWNLIRKYIDNRTCPFCGVTVTAKNFAGAFNYEGERRPINSGDLTCLIQLAKYLPKDQLTSEDKS